MKKNEPKSPVTEIIEKRYQEFLDDPDYVKGLPKLNQAKVHGTFETVKEYYSTFIHYYVYRRHMQALKARRGTLGQETEKILVGQGRAANEAYAFCVSSLEEISGHLYSSGIGKAIDRHAASVFENLDYNPKLPGMTALFEDFGVPNGSISWFLDNLTEAKHNVLRFQGMDGTFKGVVTHAKSLHPRLQESLEVTRKDGLPVIEGAGSQGGTYAAAGATVAVAILVGIIFGF